MRLAYTVYTPNSRNFSNALTSLRQEQVDLLVVSGVPQKNLSADEPTPANRHNPPNVNTATEDAIAYCAQVMDIDLRANPNEPFPFNEHFHHVIPQQEHVHTSAVNYGAGDFPLHQDRIFLENVPHFHFLACVRTGNDPAPTHFVDTDYFLQDMPETVMLELSKENYTDALGQKAVSIIRCDNTTNQKYMIVDLQTDWMKPNTTEAEQALNWLRHKSQKIPAPYRQAITINAGDLVIHNHRRLLHGRESFQPDFSNPATIRWYIRAHGILKGTALN